MMNVYLNDDRFKYEVEALIKLFIMPSSFQFINEEVLKTSQSFLLTICITQEPELKIKTELIKNREMVQQISEKDVLDSYDQITKKNVKDGIKKSVYRILKTVYQYAPPWGILTGIRPSKIVNEMMDQNIQEDVIISRLKQHYLIQDEKIKLLMEVCQNERPILNDNKKNGVSIYIGIPFCPSRCIYCSFTAYQAENKEITRYLKALIKEIFFIGKALGKSELKIETIYIGGGTPTVLSESQMRELFDALYLHFDLKDIREFTVECGRADTITHEKLQALKDYSVDRISINPQSMKGDTLITIGRKHTPKQMIEAFLMSKAYGFNSINTDLIAGLPGESVKDFKDSLKTIISLKPENITVHTLALKKASKLKAIREQYRYMSESGVRDMLGESVRLTNQYHYKPYYMYRQKYISGNLENVGYTLKGHECIYNIRIMEEKQTIIALGAGAVSKVYFPKENRHERIPNVSNYKIYIDRIDQMISRKKGLLFDNIDNKNSNTL